MGDSWGMNGVACPSCETAAAPGAKFCSECGTPLARACPSCGTPADAAAKFCAECGTPLGAAAAAPAPRPRHRPGRRAAARHGPLRRPRRLHDPSREPRRRGGRASCSRATSRRRGSVIERYGGRVEKFIGDAVMALWGAPVAQEDDAERGVRAALELVSAVEALGAEVGAATCARAGVLTGEAAVTLGAEGEGMVAGDLVNTASRVQSAAEPGTVLVGDATRRASEAAIAYEDAGTHELKGKAEPVQLWRALRVIANRGGEGRSAGLEPPFVGRDRELRLVKELFHARGRRGQGAPALGRRRSRGSASRGSPGSSRSTSTASSQTVWWHKGRCLAYGDAIAFWALAEMVRMRARITEDEPAESAPDEARRGGRGDRRRPRGARVRRAAARSSCSASTDRTAAGPRGSLLRLAPVLRADGRAGPGRPDLRGHPVGRRRARRVRRVPARVVAEPADLRDHARPAGAGRARTRAGAPSTRRFSSLFLEPLAARGDRRAARRASCPGLPGRGARADPRPRGRIPLYAVETVRMLLDRGLLERDGDEYRPSATLDALDVPETLQALIAARLDGLDPEERRLLGDASVLGKTFASRGLAALSGLGERRSTPLLAGLVRKEVLALESDPRSPERGQYGFLQALVQRVAYETLSRHDRKAKHLRAAEYLADGGRDRARRDRRGDRRALPRRLPGRRGRRRRRRDPRPARSSG